MDSFLPFLDWHHTPEGETFLQHLYNVKTSGRKLFGVLEKPYNGAGLEEVCYKLAFAGKSGSGKTYVIQKLAGISSESSYLETSGIRITDIYWPVKVWEKVILFKLQCWDAGTNSMKKYHHISTACLEKADIIVFSFSYSDASTFHELPQLMTKFLSNTTDNQPGTVVIGIRDKEKVEISKSEVKEFEQKYNIQILTIHSSGYIGPNEALRVAPILNAICEQLWVRDQQFIMKQGIKV